MISMQARFEEFVGRDTELNFLLEHLARIASGDGFAVMLLGPAGIGKTRLAEEFQKTSGSSHNFAFGACLQNARGALSPFFQILSSASDGQWSPNTDQQGPLVERTARTPPVFDSVLQGLHAFSPATSPLVLVIEDLHWADDATLHMLEHLVKHVQKLPLGVVVTCRNDAMQELGRVSATLSRLLRSGAKALYLDPLAAGDVRFLTGAALKGVHGFPAELRERIEELAAGNPLYLEELLREARDRAAEHCLSHQHIPNSLKATILERYDRLPDRIRETLTKAAALGDEFDLKMLAAVTGYDKTEIVAALQIAVDSNFIIEMDATHYRFRHALIREGLYSHLTKASSAIVHGLAAQALENQCSGGERLAERAYHWSAAMNAPMALRYNEEAGSEAMALGTYRDAIRFFRQALNFCSTDALQRATLSEKLARALYGDAEIKQAKRYFLDAIDGYLLSGAIHAAGPLISLLYNVYYYDGDTEGGLALTTRVLDLVNQADDQSVAEEFLVETAAFFNSQEMDREFNHLLSRAVTLRGGPNASLEVDWHHLRAIALAGKGKFEAAVRQFELTFELAKKAGKSASIAEVAGNFGRCYQLMGDLDRADQLTLCAMNFAEDHRLALVERCHYSIRHAEVLYFRGKLGEAESVLRRALATGANCEATRVRSAATGIRISLVLHNERLLARSADESVISLAFDSGKPLDIAYVCDAFATLYVSRGREFDARSLLKRGLARVHDSQFALDMLITVGRFGDATDLPKARALMEATCDRRTPLIRRAYTALFEALVSQREGNWPSRRRTAAVAAAAFAQLGMPLYQAEALDLAGRQKEALSIYRRVGATSAVARLEGLFRDRGRRGGLLTRRQSQVGELLSSGLSNREVARRLEISEDTLENHITAIYRRLGVRTRDALIGYFLREVR